MNQEIEYAEMLEIPVSTVNVERKKKRGRKKAAEPVKQASSPDLKETVIAQVNDKITADADLFAEGANSQGRVEFDAIPERVDTIRLYSADDLSFDENVPFENKDNAYIPPNESRSERRARIALGVEFAAACALCGAIFLTNVFMPGSAVNTFFRTLTTNNAAKTDTRTYADFTLSGVVSDFSDVELTLSPTGILTLQDTCCIYPVADGKVSEVMQNEDGTYTLKVSHSDTFTGVFEGLDCVYYAEGETIKANVPVGFTDGETPVQITMYSRGELLNCFEITDENCLAWLENE
jgi:hypothetical protein